jgi:hypothetical protein
MKEQRLLSFFQLKAFDETSKTGISSGNLIIVALLFSFMLNSVSSFAQSMGTIPIPGQNNCAITPAGSVCPNTVRTYYAPAGMSNYQWTIKGTGTISGASNTRSVNVTAGVECGYTFTLTVTMSNQGVTSTCSQVVNINDDVSPSISAMADKTAPINSTNIIFDNPTMSDNCGTPSLVIVSTTSSTANDGSLRYTRTWKAMDACGNSSTNVSQTVTVLRSLTCVITGNSSICQGSSTSLCATAGAATYLWNTGATTQCITITSAGNYSVTVGDGQGGTSTCSKLVSPATPVGCLITGNTTICSGGNTNLCGPQGGVSYQWNTGATTQCINVTTAGTYTLTMIEANGCSSTCSTVVSIGPPPACNISGNSTICQGSSTNLCASSGGTSYLWSTGATSPCISVTSAGNYSVKVTNAAGCSSTCSKSVTVNPSPSCSISGVLFICPGGTTQLCATPGMIAYSWSTGETSQCITVNSIGVYSVIVTAANGCTSSCTQTVDAQATTTCNISGNTNLCPGGTTNLCATAGAAAYAWSTGATTQCISVSTAGVYSVTITNASGCTTTCNKSVTMSDLPLCSITGNSSICPGGTTNLCGPADAVSYAWSTGATSQCISVNSTGTYSVTITNNSGCSNTCNKTITQNNPPSCSISGNGIICPGGSTNLCATQGAVSYLWNTGATTQCITVSNAATYTVTITDANGCSSTCNKTITINTLQPCNITGLTSFCAGGSTTLCAPAGATSYSWSTGATTQCLTVGSAGSYSVTIVDAQGCSTSCNRNVTVNNPPACSINGNSSYCQGSSTNLCETAAARAYAWSTGATTQCISVASPGSYSVTITDENGCVNTCSKTITENSVPQCSITGNSSFCAGGSTNLCAPAGANSYLWSSGATTQCITVNAAGNYSVTITNSNGCSSTCNKNVTVNNPPVCSISGNLLVCFGNSSNLCASAGASSYLWSTGATTQCISINNSGNYAVTVTGSNGCTSTCSQNIDVLPVPNCNVTGNSTICSGGTANLCASPGAVSYNWSTGSTAQCVNVQSPGNYTVTITGVNGCTSSCSKTVVVNTPMTCSINGNNNICSGSSTNLCVAGGARSYEWSTEATTSCITVSSPGTYSVLITDANGCISTCSQTVTVTQLPVCNISGNADICQGVNSVLTASGGNSYLWSTGATTASISVSAPATYSVTISNSNNCSSTCSKTLSTHGCGITLKKSPDICEFPEGQRTNVNFTYAITNTSDFYSASGDLVDDNGTPNNTADDVNVCSWGPLLPGETTKCYKTFSITSTHTNTAKATGTVGSQQVVASSTATVTGINCNCNLSYPDNTNLPRSGVIFNESEVLRASDPGTATCGSTGSVIKLWYNDEHALLLGVRAVSVKTFSGTTTTNYQISPSPATYGCLSNPVVGDTVSSGDQAANDVSAGGGRPLWPSIFITDLTVNGATSRIGDWQQGGKGIPPTSVCGTWKSAVKAIDKTKNPPTVTITTDADPAKNDWNLGSGSHTPPGGFSVLKDEGYGAEVSWDVNTLGLIPGHTYRLVFMVHDGDQNKTGGDVGETCTTIHIPDNNCIPVIPPPPPPPPPPTVNKVCYTGTSHSYVKASQEWTINTTTNQLTVRTTFSKNFVDNTYGISAIGWPSGHTFSQLVGSDNLQMALYDANNVKKMEFKLDYITASSGVSSGYKCLGVTGGEGMMILGNASSVISATTSIDKNLNTFGYALTTNSPSTNSSYTPNASYPNWIYDVWYEVTVDLAPFGSAGFGRPLITSVHASPSKTGSNTELVVDTICTQSSPRIALAPETPTRISAVAYPNPFGNDITINFITPLEEEATITITDLAGRVVDSFKHEAGKVNTGGDLRPGIYFVTITQGEFRGVIKIVKSGGME